jgi:predicted AAA+ superfamily ATPase
LQRTKALKTMVKYSDIKVVSEQQFSAFKEDHSLPRELLPSLPLENSTHALVISGIRRCGKSTLMRQHIGKQIQDAFYLNFDTPKLFHFEIQDFELLDTLIQESGKRNLYFDEIQVVEGWELYVRQKLDEKFNVCITGSNASLLSKELGTKLTGRHISKELFPFSYAEYLHYHTLKADDVSFMSYLNDGGFPEYVRTKNGDILSALFDDILYRDIAVRYGVRDVTSLKALLLYLAANYGNLVSANKLSGIIGIKSPKTVLEYMSYFEEAYLINRIPKFSWSLKVQSLNPQKVYFIDTALSKEITVSFTDNTGRLLENVVYWELRRHYKQLYYFNENNSECDFVVCEKNTPVMLIQVCLTLNRENQKREIDGVHEAMKYFKMDKGFIITLNQTDKIRVESGWIDVIPVYELDKYLLKSL